MPRSSMPPWAAVSNTRTASSKKRLTKTYRTQSAYVRTMVIDRRDFLKAATIPAAAGQLAAQAGARPNILFLIADDWTFRGVRGLGNAEIETPAIDGLMRRGCTFTHCFHQGSWSGAVCVPSRTMLNSGLTAFRAQKEFEQTPLWGQTFGDAGYDTTIVGKWHLSKTGLERSFQGAGAGPYGRDVRVGAGGVQPAEPGELVDAVGSRR